MESAKTGRRQFMRNIAAASFLTATSAWSQNPKGRVLPSRKMDASDRLFDQRGRWERLSMAYAHIKIGASRPFSLLHISDTHLTEAYSDEDEKKQALKENRTRTFGGRQELALNSSIEWAKKNCDMILHTGDLIDWVSEANMDLAKKYCPADMFGAMGNHEYSQNMWFEKELRTEAYKRISAKRLQESYPFKIHFDSKIFNGVNFVSFDSVYGYVTQEQADLFSDEVKKGLPIVLCTHVPFYTENMRIAHSKFWSHGKRFTSAGVPKPAGDYVVQSTDPVTKSFIRYLKTEPLLKAILAGHLHITFQEQFSATATQYLVAGNFMFHGREVLFS